MDRELRRLERDQDLDGLERLRTRGVRSEFLEGIRDRSRLVLLRTLGLWSILRTGIPVRPSDTVTQVLYGAQLIPPGQQRPRTPTRVFLLGRFPSPGANVIVRVRRDGKLLDLIYWWTGHRWNRYEIETNLLGYPRVVDH